MRLRRSMLWMGVAGTALAGMLFGSAVNPALGAPLEATPSPTIISPSPSPSGSPRGDVPSRPESLYACPPPMAPGMDFPAMVGLCWAASSGGVGGVVGYEVYRLTTDGFVKTASPTGTNAMMSADFVLGRSYTFYVVAKDAAGNISEPSALITATATTGPRPTASPTPEPGDITPPTSPTGLRDYCVADGAGVNFCWNASTDDVGVSGYDVYRRTATGYVKAGSRTTTWFYETDVVTGRYYTYFVVARDAAGNLSRPSDLISALAHDPYPWPTPTPTPPPNCKVTYGTWSWESGFGTQVRITNISPDPIDGWTLRFRFSDSGQKVANGWSAAWSQEETYVYAEALPWNSVIQPGASVDLGFNGTHTGANPVPPSFTLNRVPCIAG
ncbi:cellulose binding domain-containing protein [Sphaerimonospora mesophila]|uniref:cellulose binding domain-containing protein n=1 Tax=Sphaerimonospora mesophila TaxID=37483 RepID=UPI0009FA30AD